MKKILFVLSTFILFNLSFIFLLTQNVFACFPAGPDPWFETKLSFDQSTLPNGIEIVQTDPTYEPYAIINKNLEPFYLVRENFTDWRAFPNSELPAKYEPRFKITANQVYFWGQLSSQDAEGWKPNSGGINNSAATKVGINESIYILDGKSKQIYEDNRPSIVEIPDPQNFRILGFFKDNPIEINGTIFYSLNEEYNPHKFAEGVEACNNLNEVRHNPLRIVLTLLPVMIVLVTLTGICLLIYKILRRLKT